MNVYWISSTGAEPRPVQDLKTLLAMDGGFVWMDVPRCDEAAARTMSEVFGFHPMAVRDCLEQSHLPKVHAYADHLFMILHAPEPDAEGRIHLTELDQFIGRRFLVTVHGATDERHPSDSVQSDIRNVLQRIESGRSRPSFPGELSYAVVSAFARRIEALVSALASKVDALEQQVMKGHRGDPEQMLETMFSMRHEILTIRTIAAHSREAYTRIGVLASRFMPAEERPYIDDLMDQFDRIRSMCDSEQEFLRGVIDFYQNRTITKLNVAMERLALISVLLLPVTAIASIYGMNIIVNDRTQPIQVALVLAVIGVMVVAIFLWARRRGWW